VGVGRKDQERRSGCPSSHRGLKEGTGRKKKEDFLSSGEKMLKRGKKGANGFCLILTTE